MQLTLHKKIKIYLSQKIHDYYFPVSKFPANFQNSKLVKASHYLHVNKK